MFSSKSFTVSGLTFKSLIHFEGFFVYGIGKGSNSILLHVFVQFSQHHLLKRLSFLYPKQSTDSVQSLSNHQWLSHNGNTKGPK